MPGVLRGETDRLPDRPDLMLACRSKIVWPAFMNSLITAPPLSGNVLGCAGDSFVIAEWRDGGGSFDPPRLIAPLHVHRSDDEAWYILEGVLRVRRGDEVVEVRAGSGILVPRGTPHTYWNPNPEPARYLLVMTPNIYQLIQGIHALTERSPAAIRALFERHDSSLVDG
jgi:mannose-6-phosphate isomerase-like protein (cupin superfamily)